MSDGYNLQPNEYMILKSKWLHYEDSHSERDALRKAVQSASKAMSIYTYELLLTNLNIVLIGSRTSLFGSKKDIRIQAFPVNQIKVFNGRAQAISSNLSGKLPRLEIYFLNGQEAFCFQTKKEADQWAESINQLVTGNSADFQSSQISSSGAISGTEIIAETIKGTVDVFKGVFGSKPKATRDNSNEKVIQNRKCTSCGAPASGRKGQVVSCRYCGTRQHF